MIFFDSTAILLSMAMFISLSRSFIISNNRASYRVKSAFYTGFSTIDSTTVVSSVDQSVVSRSKIKKIIEADSSINGTQVLVQGKLLIQQNYLTINSLLRHQLMQHHYHQNMHYDHFRMGTNDKRTKELCIC